MIADVDLTWPASLTEELAGQSHALIGTVTALGGAIGWMSPPPRAETDEWLAGAFARIAAGDGALCAAWRDGGWSPWADGCGRRSLLPAPGRAGEDHGPSPGPGRAARAARPRALITSAAEAGIETLHLGVRGNNDLAIQLYEKEGFVEWGRLPDVIEAGDERFDDVRMYLKLSSPARLILRGSHPSGPGCSARRR